METKSLFASKTILGILLAALGAFVDFGPQLQQVLPASWAAVAGKGVVIAGLLLAVYGRVKAAVPLTLPGKGSGGFAERSFLIVLAMLSLFAFSWAACSTVQPTPQKPGQMLAVAEADYTAIVKAATSARASGLITEEVAAKLTPIFERANGALALANEALDAHNSGDFTRWLGVVNRAIVEANALVPR